MSFDFIRLHLFPCSSSAFWPWMLGLLANATLLLAALLLAGAVLGRGRAPLRSLVGALGLAALAVLPGLSLLLVWQRGLAEALYAPGGAGGGWLLAAGPERLARGALLLWALGALIILGRLLVDLVLLSLHVRSLPPHPGWTALATGRARGLGIRRRVRVLRSGTFDIPCAWGLLRPVILMPRGAGSWTRERVEAVLLHELGHVRRWDGLSTALSRTACALFWFHPLAWWVHRRTAEDAERSCDRIVVEAGMAPQRYAGHLLGIVRDSRGAAARLAPGMAAESMLSRRIAALLESPAFASRLRRTTGLAAAIGVVLGTLVLTEISSPDPGEDGNLLAVAGGLDCPGAPPPVLESRPEDVLQSLQSPPED